MSFNGRMDNRIELSQFFRVTKYYFSQFVSFRTAPSKSCSKCFFNRIYNVRRLQFFVLRPLYKRNSQRLKMICNRSFSTLYLLLNLILVMIILLKQFRKSLLRILFHNNNFTNDSIKPIHNRKIVSKPLPQTSNQF
jgi:hypothetical protein